MSSAALGPAGSGPANSPCVPIGAAPSGGSQARLEARFGQLGLGRGPEEVQRHERIQAVIQDAPPGLLDELVGSHLSPPSSSRRHVVSFQVTRS